MQTQKIQKNNFTSSDELAGVYSSGLLINRVLTTSVYRASTELNIPTRNQIESNFTDSQLNHFCSEMSYTSFAEHWEKEEDEYWALYLK